MLNNTYNLRLHFVAFPVKNKSLNFCFLIGKGLEPFT